MRHYCPTIPEAVALVVILLFCDARVSAFHIREVGDASLRKLGLRNATRRPQKISSAISSAHPAEQPESPLSGLVQGMLEAQKEIARETRELSNLAIQNLNPAIPILGSDGVYNILNEEQLHNFQSTHSNKLVILKFSSPVCKACRDLKQKFRHLGQSPKFAGKPVVFADITLSNNKHVRDPFRDYVTSQLLVQKIPSLQFYAPGSHLVSTVGCDPETGCSWSKLKEQMIGFVEQWASQIQTEQAATIVSTIKDEDIVELVSPDMESITALQPNNKQSLFQTLKTRIEKALSQRQQDC
jgi:thiol-disulfide isomerase/thioredoxin